VSFVVTNISSLGISLSRTALPTACSLPYPYAVSRCLYPTWCMTYVKNRVSRLPSLAKLRFAAYLESLLHHLVRLRVILGVCLLAHPTSAKTVESVLQDKSFGGTSLPHSKDGDFMTCVELEGMHRLLDCRY
jgi:hypothetical protein